MNDIKNVCVYSASSTKIAKVYFDVAEELGRLLAEKKINLINGAGCIGLMAATSDAALAAGGTVTGVIPHFMVEQDWYHKGLTELIEVETICPMASLHCPEVAAHWRNCLKSSPGSSWGFILIR